VANISVTGGTLVSDIPVQKERQKVVETISAVNENNVSVKRGTLAMKRVREMVDVIQGGIEAMNQPKTEPEPEKTPFDPDREFSQSFRTDVTPPPEAQTAQVSGMTAPQAGQGVTPPQPISSPQFKTTESPSISRPEAEERPTIGQLPPIQERPEVEVTELPDTTAASGVQPTDGKVEVSSTDEDYKDPTEVIAKEPAQALAQSQALLKETGHYRDTVDGLSGANTTNAVKTFQYENGLEVTGELDLQTRTKLGSGTATKRPEISDSNNPLLSFIAKGESGGYGAANNGTTDRLRGQRKLFSVLDSFYSDTYSKPLEKMTVKEVMTVQLAKSGASMDELLKHVKDNTNKDGQYIASNSELDNREFFAVGAYQIIPLTMAGAINSMGLTGDEVFNQELQDRIAIEYLAGSKRPKLQAWLRGEQNVTRAEAHEELAKEWASIPIGEEVTRKGQTMVRGESYYKPENNVANAHTAEEVESLLDSLRPKNVGLDVPTTTDQGQEQ